VESRKEEAIMSTTAQWTWLVYMAGDNNLQGAGGGDLAEMKQVGSTDQVNVIVQFDTEANKTTRYRVEKKKLKVLQQMKGVNCGNPKVLTGFLAWGIKTFPARHYLVDVWNHGGGWENLPADYDYNGLRSLKPASAYKRLRLRRAIFKTTIHAIRKRPAEARAIAIDCGSHDYLDNQELRKALAAALPGGKKFDIFACDACLMNMLEIAYEMKDTAQVMVGSEETEPGAGWPYAAILKALVAQPAMGPSDLAKVVVSEYEKYFTKAHTAATQSALALDRIHGIASAVNALAAALLADIHTVAGTVTLARDHAQKYEMPEYIDLGDFASQLAQRLPHGAGVQAAVSSIKSTLNSSSSGAFVIANATSGAGVAKSTGVSIYFPHAEDYAPDYGDLLFSKQGKWRELLQAIFNA
jgi:hypothetical protein